MLLARGHAAAALRGLAATSTRHEALVDDAVNPPLVRALLDAFESVEHAGAAVAASPIGNLAAPPPSMTPPP